MRKDKRSVNTCLLITFASLATMIGILLASMDLIKERLGLEKPESEVGSFIDQNIPQIEAVHQQRRMKNALQLTAHMKAIKDAYARFYITRDHPPADLQELVTSGEIDRSALADLWGQPHLLIKDNQDVYMISRGPDRIGNTADDLAISMLSPGLELPDEEKAKLPALLIDHVLSEKK